MVQWILENWAKEQSFKDLADEVKAQGHPLIELRDFKASDFSHLQNQCVIFNGSIQMAQIMSNTLKTCYPVSWCSSEKYLCSKYYSYFGDYLFNDRYSLIPFSELNRQKFLFYGVYGKQALMFIRPDSGNKTFQAQVVDFQDFETFYSNNYDTRHDLVLVSSPKTIRGEWRFVVTAEKEIIAYSTYQYQGLRTLIPSAPQGAIDLCNELLQVGYYPDVVFCIDICEDGDGRFWLLELTSYSSAGLYECNKKKIVTRISEIAQKEYDSLQSNNVR